jgi:NTP pyrophosphatase (non-canonical NTP hydrolase)
MGKKIIFPITSKNGAIDNNELSVEDLMGKLIEETQEVDNEVIKHRNADKIASGLFDVIQVVIAMLDKLGVDIEEMSHQHLRKLSERGWQDKGFVSVEVSKNESY